MSALKITADRIAVVPNGVVDGFIIEDCLHKGGNGYVYLLETFLPRLREAGLPESAIRAMTVDNPRCVFEKQGAY